MEFNNDEDVATADAGVVAGVVDEAIIDDDKDNADDDPDDTDPNDMNEDASNDNNDIDIAENGKHDDDDDDDDVFYLHQSVKEGGVMIPHDLYVTFPRAFQLGWDSLSGPQQQQLIIASHSIRVNNEDDDEEEDNDDDVSDVQDYVLEEERIVLVNNDDVEDDDNDGDDDTSTESTDEGDEDDEDDEDSKFDPAPHEQLTTHEVLALAGFLIEEEREGLLSFYLQHKPTHHENVAITDCIFLIDTCIKMGILTLNDDDDSNRFFDLNTMIEDVDDNGRIIRLSIISPEPTTDDGEYYDLPVYDLHPTIVRLEKLEDLDLESCRSIPSNFPELKHLSYLRIKEGGMSRNGFVVPIEMELSNLTFFSVSGINLRDDDQSLMTTSNFLMWLESKVPNLTHLYMDQLERSTTESVIVGLCDDNLNYLHQNLESININGAEIDDDLFEKIILQVLPKFSILKSVSIGNNKIQSFESVSLATIPPTVTSLSLYHNPVTSKFKSDPEESKFLIDFLNHNNNVFDINGQYFASTFAPSWYTPEIIYALRINHAGRNLIVNNKVNNNKNMIPLSLWPIVLERAYTKSNEIQLHARNFSSRDNLDSSGVFYILQQIGPTLVDWRSTGGCVSTSTTLSSSTDGNLKMSSTAARGRKRTITVANNNDADGNDNDENNNQTGSDNDKTPRKKRSTTTRIY